MIFRALSIVWCVVLTAAPALAQSHKWAREYKPVSFQAPLFDDTTITAWLLLSVCSLLAGIGIGTYKYLYSKGESSKSEARQKAFIVVVLLLVPTAISFSSLVTFFHSSGNAIFVPLVFSVSTLFAAIFSYDHNWATACDKYKKCNYSEAIKYFELAIIKQQKNSELYVWCTNAHICLDQFEEAIAVCDRALSLIPDALEIRAQKVGILIEIARVDEALIELNQLIEQHPEYEYLLELRSELFMQQYQFDKAIADLDTMKKPSLWSKIKRCQAHVGLNQNETATNEFHHFMRNLDERLPRQQMALLMGFSGWMRIIERKFDIAIQEFTTSLELDPHSVWQNLNRAYCYLVEGKHDLALNDIAMVQAKTLVGRKKLYCHFLYSLYLWRIGDLPRALAAAHDANGIYGDKAMYLSNLGLMQMVNGQLDEARISLDNAIALNPHNAEAHYYRLRLFQKMGLDDLAGADRQKMDAWNYHPYFDW
ncbi:MAG: hypothetical protein KIT34_15555 [Cyanobacteria bacterium TGS_CYA1]|nr:hypothetical protein [Cyanobacteria bacterium TGS_CYA1]